MPISDIAKSSYEDSQKTKVRVPRPTFYPYLINFRTAYQCYETAVGYYG